MAYSGPYGPPLVDFSQLDPIGSYEKGATIRRQYTARSELAKCDPNDFNCMSKVLMQLDPAEGVRMAQLQNQLQHQSFQEDLATKQLAAQEENNRFLREARAGRESRAAETYQAPFGALESGVPGYAAARDTLMSTPLGGGFESLLGGAPIKEIEGFAGRVADAQHLKGEARKAYVREHTPGALDFARGRAGEMFSSLERDAASLGYPVPAYAPEAAPPGPQAGHAAPSALRSAATPPPPAGAVPPPVTVSPPGGEAATAGEVQPHTVRTVPILPKIKKGSPEEQEALRQARDKIAAHPNDPQVKAQVLQRLIDLGITQ